MPQVSLGSRSEKPCSHFNLRVSAGVVLHFKIPVIKDYYIIDPQRWFDLCSLVISPDNVSSLVRAAGRPGGNLSCM